MQHTRTKQRTDTTQAARYVTNRLRGDLRAIHEKFNMSSMNELMNLAGDIELGLSHDCLSGLSLFLYPPAWTEPLTAYIYERVAPRSFAHSPHSGRIARCAPLIGDRLTFEVTLLDSNTWASLKPRLKINWISCTGTSTAGMAATSDGGYASGELGFSRTRLQRQGY